MSSLQKVVANGNCIGCGACAFAHPGLATMHLSEEGHWLAALTVDKAPSSIDEAGAIVCPMSGETPNETELATAIFPDLEHSDQIGHYARNVVGHVQVGEFRAAGGSGGLVTWLLSTLIESGEVDAVIHVRPTPSDGNEPLFGYGVSSSVSEIMNGAKSRYYPVQMADVLSILATQDKRFAIVGLPCFLKAVRLLERSGHIPADRVIHTVGLVCGHLKSSYFADYLAWQKGILPGQLAGIDFRWKLADQSASNYGFAVQHRDSESIDVYPMKSVKARDWGEGMFKNPACEFCDDVLAECADIAVGDAWLPQYVSDWRGTNVAVIRSASLNAIIARAEQNGLLLLKDVDVKQIAESQAAGLRHRRRGLMHRLARRKNAGQWAPKKRVRPMLERSPSRRKVYDIRLRIAQESSRMFAAARSVTDLNAFENSIAPLLNEYRAALKGSIARQLAKHLKSKVRTIIKKVFSSRS